MLAHQRFGMAGFPAVLYRAFLSWCLGELGEFAEGIAVGEDGVRIAEVLGQAYSVTVARVGLGGVRARRRMTAGPASRSPE
jgi:hypothetical protein